MIVVWRVTEVCNLSCPFCAYDRRLAYPRRQADPQQIRAAGAVFSAWQRVSKQPLLVSWLGGEPLLWQPLSRLTAEFVETHGLRISTTTNGTTLHRPETRDHLLRYYTELTISVDALGERHDQWRGAPGLFGRVRENVSSLADAARIHGSPLKLRANVVLMSDNAAEFPSLCRELARWGIREISFNSLGGRDRPEFFPTNRLRSDQTEELIAQLPELRAELAKCGVNLLGGDAYLRRMRATSAGRPMPVDDCQPGETFLFIDERGRVSPCSFTCDDYGADLAGLMAVESLRGLPELFRSRRAEKRARACEDCMSTQVFTKFATAHGS